MKNDFEYQNLRGHIHNQTSICQRPFKVGKCYLPAIKLGCDAEVAENFLHAISTRQLVIPKVNIRLYAK